MMAETEGILARVVQMAIQSWPAPLFKNTLPAASGAYDPIKLKPLTRPTPPAKHGLAKTRRPGTASQSFKNDVAFLARNQREDRF